MASGGSFRAVSAVATGTTSLTIDLPTGTLQDDVMLMVLAHKGGGYATVPAGWTVIEQRVTGDGTRGEVLWKRAGGVEPANYSVTGLATIARGAISSYEGVLLSGDPVDASTSRVNASGAGWPYTAELTSLTADVLVLGAVIRGGAGSTGTFTLNGSGPSTEIKAWKLRQVASSSVSTLSMIVSDAWWGIARNMGALRKTAVEGFTTESIGILVALKPEPLTLSAVNRFYPTKRTVGSLLEGPLQGVWADGISTRDTRGLAHWTFLLAPTKAGGGSSGTTSEIFRYSFGDDSETGAADDVVAYRWITPTLNAQTLGGTLQICFPVSPSTASPDTTAKFKIHVYLTTGDTLTPRATLINNYVDATDFSANFQSLTAAQSLPAQVVTDGDRIVIEVGARLTLNSGTSNRYFMGFGTGYQDGQMPYVDAVAAEGLGNRKAPWVHFSTALDTDSDRASSPANVAAASATSIASLPFSGGPVDATGSTGYHRALWWTWTAPSTMRVIVSTFGGNATTEVLAWTSATPATTGDQASVLSGSLPSQVSWIGRSQSTLMFDAVASQQYWIEVRSRGYLATTTATSAFAVSDEGGSIKIAVAEVSTPETDDIIIDSQYLIHLRNGVVIGVQGSLYDNTPTGSVIDATGRVIDDRNGGTQSDDRIIVALFGPSYLEIFDVATLGIKASGFTDLDYIDAAINGGPTDSVRPSSLIMDRSGNVYVGYFGDNYSVLGTPPSTPDVAAIVKVNATHGDNQSGAPWTLATRYVVDLENSGPEFLDIASDQSTIYYTSAGRRILRFNTTTSTQLADFVTLASETGSRPGLRGLRLLPPGDGSGGLIVADGINVKRLDSGGAVVATYTPTSTSGIAMEDLDKVELTEDAGSFWVSDQWTGHLFRFNLSSAAQTQEIAVGTAAGQTCGFSTRNGFRAGTASPPTPTPEPPTTPPPTPQPCDCDTPSGSTPPPDDTIFAGSYWVASCGFGGTVSSSADITNSEDWDPQ